MNIQTCSREEIHWNSTQFQMPWFPREPVASFSGLTLIGIVLAMTRNIRTPVLLEFWMFHASLFACGIGTFLYHALHEVDVSNTGLNIYMLDGITMTLSMSALILLHGGAKYPKLTGYFQTFYVFYSAVTNDSMTFSFLNGKTDSLFFMFGHYVLYALLYTSLIGYNVYYQPDTRFPLISSLLLALLGWMLDRFVCVENAWIGHAAWHVFIAYNSTLLALFGLRVRGYVVHGQFWPVVTSVYVEEVVVDMLTLKDK